MKRITRFFISTEQHARENKNQTTEILDEINEEELLAWVRTEVENNQTEVFDLFLHNGDFANPLQLNAIVEGNRLNDLQNHFKEIFYNKIEFNIFGVSRELNTPFGNFYYGNSHTENDLLKVGEEIDQAILSSTVTEIARYHRHELFRYFGSIELDIKLLLPHDLDENKTFNIKSRLKKYIEKKDISDWLTEEEIKKYDPDTMLLKEINSIKETNQYTDENYNKLLECIKNLRFEITKKIVPKNQ